MIEKVCPECAESVKEAARVCRFCGHRFGNVASFVTAAAGSSEGAELARASLAYSRDAWRKPPISSGPSWWERTFDRPFQAQVGCLLVLALMVCLGVASYRYLNHRQQLRAAGREEAAFAARTAERAEGLEERLSNRRKGLHCLSPVDGSHPDVVRVVKDRLADPDSFQHIKTLVFPADAMGRHRLLMTYRGRNGFGGMVRGRATAKLYGLSCGAGLEAVE